MTEKIDFITGCPVRGCDNSHKANRWEHANCGGKEWIDEEGYIECKKCGKKFFLLNSTFKCERHNYEDPDFQSIIRTLSSLSLFNSCSEKFIHNLISNIMRHR